MGPALPMRSCFSWFFVNVKVEKIEVLFVLVAMTLFVLFFIFADTSVFWFLFIVCFCPGELQYNPSTTGIFLVSIHYFKWT